MKKPSLDASMVATKRWMQLVGLIVKMCCNKTRYERSYAVYTITSPTSTCDWGLGVGTESITIRKNDSTTNRYRSTRRLVLDC
jgi:hypothetical protein